MAEATHPLEYGGRSAGGVVLLARRRAVVATSVRLRDEAWLELEAPPVTSEDSDVRRRVLRQLAVLAELRDDATREHTDRVGRSAAIIASACGMGPASVRTIAAAAMLHDVGKIAIPAHILLKPGRLDPHELAVMRRHAQIGAAILGSTGVPELRLGESIALGHHEHWDGGGYPQGLAGEAIPIAARIAAIADVFDALVHERPYKHAWTIDEALAEIARQRGRQFDPQLVDVFLALDHEQLVERLRDDRAALAA